VIDGVFMPRSGDGRSPAGAGEPQEVTLMGTIHCERCNRDFNTLYDNPRLRAGSFYDTEREESFDELCEDCYREVVKER
jgi:hypothetical protein